MPLSLQYALPNLCHNLHTFYYYFIVHKISLKCSHFDFYRAFRSKLGGKVGLYGRHKWCEMYAVICTQFKMAALVRKSLETAGRRFSVYIYDVKVYLTL